MESIKANLKVSGLFGVCLILSGCNTMEGLGTDIKKGGEALERTADRNKPRDTSTSKA